MIQNNIIQDFNSKKFPLDTIRQMSAGKSYMDLNKLEISNDKTVHYVDKQPHDCYLVTWDTKFDGIRCSFSYKFCAECKKFFDKRGVLFDFEDSIAYTHRFEATANELFNGSVS